MFQHVEAEKKPAFQNQTASSLLPRRTTSKPAKRLHAMLRSYPGYELAVDSPQRVNWTIHALLALAEDRPDFVQELPNGCIGAVYWLADCLPFCPAFTKELSIDTLCSLIVQLGYHCSFVAQINETFKG